MIKYLALFIALICALFVSCVGGPRNTMNGDIIFQDLESSQSNAVKLATGSRYSHMGIIYKTSSGDFVYEALNGVMITPLETWIGRGKGKHFVIKRLANAKEVLTEKVLANMKAEGEKLKRRPYDIYFGWADDRIYCSELAWKIYKRGVNIEVGELRKLGSFRLDDPIVKQLLVKRYGTAIPLEETVISPEDMFDSKLLVKVIEE
jgi:hypothetical protein